MRISDWSSDVCSSDLPVRQPEHGRCLLRGAQGTRPASAADPPREVRFVQVVTARAGIAALVGDARAPPNSCHIRHGAASCHPEPSAVRSEEHTSELQSLMRISYAVFCVKKKTQQP